MELRRTSILLLGLCLLACSDPDAGDTSQPAGSSGQSGTNAGSGGQAGNSGDSGQGGAGGLAGGSQQGGGAGEMQAGASGGGQAGAAGHGGAATLEDFLSSYKQLLCSAVEACCSQVGQQGSTCADDITESIGDDPITYNPELGGQCLDAVLLRTQQSGFCFISHTYIVQPDFLCKEALGKGTSNFKSAKLGEPCGYNKNFFLYTSVEGDKSEETVCDTQKGIWCNPKTKVCEPVSDSGPCVYNGLGGVSFGCAFESGCSQENVCVPLVPVGGACEEESQCPPGYGCSGTCVRCQVGVCSKFAHCQ